MSSTFIVFSCFTKVQTFPTLVTISSPFAPNSSPNSQISITMKLSALLTAFALLAPAVFAAPLPACSTTSTTPCSCPSGTAYEQSVTFAVIGASAADVKNLTSDCPSTAKSLLK